MTGVEAVYISHSMTGDESVYHSHTLHGEAREI
jgi:hypothetical protein